MSIGTIGYLGIVIFIFIYKRVFKDIYMSMLALHIFICTAIEVGYFMKIGDSLIPYRIFSEVVMVMLTLIVLMLKRNLKRDLTIPYTIIATLIGIVGLLIYPLKKLIVAGGTLIDMYWDGWAELSYPTFDGHSISCFIHYITFLIILAGIINYFDRKDYEKLLHKVASISTVILVIGCIEFVLKNFFRSNLFIELVDVLFGHNENVFTWMELRGILFRLSGLTTEASHFSYTLFVIGIVFVADYCLTSKGRWKIILAAILNMATMAFSSVLYVLIFFCMCILVKNKNQNDSGNKIFKIVGLVTIASVIFTILYNTPFFQNSYVGQRLHEVFSDALLRTDISDVRNYTYTSSRIRIISMLTTLELVVYRPLFGIGIGTTSSHGSFAAILSGLGFVGTFLWLKALFYNSATKQFKIYKKTYNMLIALWCAAGLFVSMFWGMLYNASNYALMISFLVMCDRDTNKLKI